ncbi:MAG TPA: anthranilate synthase component I family protein [Chitinophagaceae bacterium]|nr:anthranilate synthase component I family protein [Chitinophagaceae bacterium]
MSATNTNCIFTITDPENAKKKMLSWANQFGIFCFLDNHRYQTNYHSIECLLAVGNKNSFIANAGNALNDLQSFLNENPRWLFGHLGYDLKNEIESVTSSSKSRHRFPDIFFFEPKIIIRLSEKEMEIECEDDAGKIFNEIMQNDERLELINDPVNIQQRVSRKEYIETIEQLKKHILRGDCYEINYCMEFFAEDAVVDPLSVYEKLSRTSPNPFSALYKLEDKWLICASPERFLKREGNKILSQPIKGTSSRFLKDDNQDKKSKDELYTSEKDRSENVMVVDLVRNDLARVCKEGTVKVDELFGIYSFPQVHQMISTVSGELKDNISFTEIIKATFPMGSMTGAPKRRVIELIDQYERSGRGIFSGAVGYITPENDFDFNVAIRSIMYNASEKYLSFMAGSGITFYSDAEKEYEECLLKAEAMRGAILGN